MPECSRAVSGLYEFVNEHLERSWDRERVED